MFILADRGTGETYIHSAKTSDKLTIRLLLSNRQQEPLTVYTDGFRAYDPLDEDDAFDREYSSTAKANTLVTTFTSAYARGVSKDKLTPYLRGLQLCQRVRRKHDDEALKITLKTAL